MTLATEACRHLRIEILYDQDQQNGRANLARMVSSSPYLQTLEISFEILTYNDREWIVKLSELFGAGAHWPNLKRLKLQALGATDISLKKLLTTHAASLRSLELAHIILEQYQQDGEERRGSWVEIIPFLQTSLRLDTVRLGGYLRNGWDEKWILRDPDESYHWLPEAKQPPERGSCLKHRVERFVVEGGPCPLLMPHEAAERDCVGFGDESWRYLRSCTGQQQRVVATCSLHEQ